MKIGISTYYAMNSKSVVEAVKQLKGAGVDTVELMYESKYKNPIPEKEVGFLRSFGLDYSMHAPYSGLTFAHPNEKQGDFLKDIIQDSLECAINIGCTDFVMHGGKIPSSFMKVEEGYSRKYFVELFVERYGKLFEKYNTKGLNILIENLQDLEIGGKVSDITWIRQVLPFVGFCFDIAHSENTGTTQELIKAFGDSIHYVHVTDNDKKTDQHLALGEGEIDLEDIFRKINGFDGKAIIECLNFDDCIKSREYLTKHFK